jgi:NitT/TauT family transport system substrate-binding protein
VISRAEGGKVKAIGVVFSKGPWTVFYRKEVGIKGPKDLEGKTVAGAGPGDIDIVLLPALCKVAGVDFNKINVISVDWGSILPMLLARKVDASVEFVFRWANLERDAKAAGVDVGYFLYADYGLNMYSNGFMTRDDVIKNKPELVRGFIKATMKGYKYAFEHPDEAIDILLKYNPELDREVARKELDIMRDLVFVPEIEEHGLGWMSKERWTTTRDMVTELFNLTTKVPVEDLYTNEFLE